MGCLRHFGGLCLDRAPLGNYAEWELLRIRNEKRPSHAGNLLRAGILDGKHAVSLLNCMKQ
jgi:hypothetical protein